MDTRMENCKETRPRRPIRNKRYSRRGYGEERRPPKRLFTPEIKRYLKEWLVRRRDNPYPNRDEKKALAVQTGLTYIQVCNWFANWRRKLKNSGKEPQRKTWGNLIKTYNSQVHGNVEHFSICSDDSIWEEPEESSHFDDEKQFKYNQNYNYDYRNTYKGDHSYDGKRKHIQIENQCYFISSTTTEAELEANPFAQPANKYKNHIMEKYLRDCQQPSDYNRNEEELTKPSMISRWLESAANFRPSEDSYLDWTFQKNEKKKCNNKAKHTDQDYNNLSQIHGREELDAAEALTTLANARACKI